MRLIDADVADKWMRQNNSFIDAAILKAIPTIDAVPELDVEPVIKSHWQLVDEKNGTGVCGNCHRQDYIDPLARYCRYCGARMVKEVGEKDEC